MRDVLAGVGIISFSLGIIFASFFLPTTTVLILVSLLGSGVLIYALFSTQKVVLSIGVGILALVLGMVRFLLLYLLR